MSIVDLTNCKQEEGESTTHWVRRVKAIIHSSDKMDAGSAVLMLEKNCHFLPLKMKLARLKRDCNDMGTLTAALVKYANFESTKDAESDDENTGKGKKRGNTKGPQHNPTYQGGNNKCKADGSLEFVANSNVQGNNQRRKGRPPPRGPMLEQLLNEPCLRHVTPQLLATHLWKECTIMKAFKNSNMFDGNHGQGGNSGGGGFHGPGGGSNSNFQNSQGNQGGYNQQSSQGGQ